MHGDMDQKERDIIMREFRSGSSRVLITTDLHARRHGPEGARHHHARVPLGILSRSHHHRSPCTATWTRRSETSSCASSARDPLAFSSPPISTHGDMDQKERDIIMREFRSGSSRVLITTDLL